MVDPKILPASMDILYQWIFEKPGRQLTIECRQCVIGSRNGIGFFACAVDPIPNNLGGVVVASGFGTSAYNALMRLRQDFGKRFSIKSPVTATTDGSITRGGRG